MHHAYMYTMLTTRRYEGIPKVVSACMDAHHKDAYTKTPTLDDILAVDEWARAFVREWKP